MKRPDSGQLRRYLAENANALRNFGQGYNEAGGYAPGTVEGLPADVVRQEYESQSLSSVMLPPLFTRTEHPLATLRRQVRDHVGSSKTERRS